MRVDKKRAQQVCKDGLLHAERLVKLDPKHAEGWALMAGLEGLSLSFASPMAGMTLGPKMEEELRRAVTLEPKNPRVRLIQGINTFHKPKFVGGGPEPALPILESAQKLFAAEAATDSTAPAWGHDDAYLWAGQAEMGLKHYGEAREAYLKALEANPDNAWVRVRLLPEAEKALATAATSNK
jgi:tetratricopeptide (TPR) repeat protein